MRTVILVPYRGDNGRRDELWAFTQKWVSQHNWPIYLGESPDGLFNRSRAINDASEQASDWDAALIMDADTIVPTNQITAAHESAVDTGRLAMAFTSVLELNEACTNHVLKTGGDLTLATLGVDNMRRGPKIDESSAMLITRQLWERIGGFDEAFVGWACEDNAFYKAATIIAGQPTRQPGHAFHLWHPPATDINTRERDPQYRRNFQRWLRYNRARNEAQLHQIRAT